MAGGLLFHDTSQHMKTDNDITQLHAEIEHK